MVDTKMISQVVLQLLMFWGGNLVASDDTEAIRISGLPSVAELVTSLAPNSNFLMAETGAEIRSLKGKRITRPRGKAHKTCIEMDDSQMPNSYGEGTRFLPGQFTCLADNKFGLTKEGKIVYMVGENVVWEANIDKDKVATKMVMGQGGNLVAYDGTGSIWISGRRSSDGWVAKRVPHSRLLMTETGAEIRSPNNEVTWRLNISDGVPSDPSCIKIDVSQMPNSYGQGTRFLPGQFACLGDNKFGLTKEGKIVYMVGDLIVWDPNNKKENMATKMYLGRGGNLVARDGHKTIWLSGWPTGVERVAKRATNSRFVMTETGAEIRSPEDELTWKLDLTPILPLLPFLDR